MSVVCDSQNVSGQNSTATFRIPECRLSEDLGNLLDTAQFADVILIPKGREIKAHKSILACKCSTAVAISLSALISFVRLHDESNLRVLVFSHNRY